MNELRLAKERYNTQKQEATNYRGIDWQLTFEEWWNWWQATGHYHERGKRRGQYVMARIGDVGPYALWNIKCITHSENVREGYTNGKPRPVGVRTRKVTDEDMKARKREREKLDKIANPEKWKMRNKRVYQLKLDRLKQTPMF